MLRLLLACLFSSVLICESRQHCTPIKADFRSASGSSLPSSFNAVSVSDSFGLTMDGLELYLKRPKGEIKQTGRVNSELAEGATINSTFTYLCVSPIFCFLFCILIVYFSYGRVTFDISAPTLKGVVTAVINIGGTFSSLHYSPLPLIPLDLETALDEVDIEILGSDSLHWQTNVFVPSEEDSDPHYGELSSIEPLSDTISEFHKYTIDWSAERITWSVDGKLSRTLRKGTLRHHLALPLCSWSLVTEDTKLKGVLHYPTQPSRLQLGVWDASSPVGTSEWAGGPIDWKKSRGTIAAVVRSVELECP